MSVLTESELRALVSGVWTGQYNAERIPPWLFNKLADEYQGAALSGYGRLLSAGTAADQALERSLRQNVYYFAAHKSAQELNDMNQLMLASKNKYDFTKKAIQVDDKYNQFWFETEYSTTRRLARAGQDWRAIEQTKNTFPKLQYVAVHDENTRHEHAILDGTIRPVGDLFWNTYYPPLGWNCRCRVVRMETGLNTDLRNRQLPPVIEEFKNRVTKSRTIWSTGHPYFDLQAVMPAPKAVRVKKAIDVIVKAKIAEEDAPYVFTSPQDLLKQIQAIKPGVPVNVDHDLTAEFLKEQAGNFHLPRFTKNLIKELEDKGIRVDTINIQKQYRGVRLTVEHSFQGRQYPFMRTFDKRQRGICVHHDYFKLHPDLQGGGLSRRVFKHLYKEYQQAKVVYIDVNANLEAGGAVWAKYGFQMSMDDITHYINHEMLRMTPELRQKGFKMLEKFKAEHPGQKYIPMNIFVRGGFEDNMTGTHWDGFLDLTDKKQRDFFENYLYHGYTKPQ